MKVLHVIPALAPRYGGPSAAVLDMCRALDAVGCETMIATTDADGPERLPVPCGSMHHYEGVRAIFFPRYDERFKYSPELSRWLYGNVSRYEIVHVHAVFSHSSIAAAGACHRARLPYVLRPLGSLDPWGLGRNAVKKRVLRWAAVDRMVDRAAEVHFTTPDEQRLARLTYPDVRGVTIPLGIADSLLHSIAGLGASREPIIATVGRLHPVKNLESVIGAVDTALSNDSTTPWRLVIAGDGECAYRDRLRSLAGKTPIADRIEFTGWLDAHEKTRLLRRATLFIQASHQESFGLSLLEALAHGVPVIASRSVNLADAVVRAGAGWMTGSSTEAIAATLRDALRDADDLARRSVRARELAAKFAWSEIAASLRSLYARLGATTSMRGAASDVSSSGAAWRNASR